MSYVPAAPPTTELTKTPAAPPAPHQIAAFNAEKVVAKVVLILGAVVTIGGALLPAVTNILGAHSPTVILAGAIITAAGSLQHALATSSFQAATDN